MTNFIVVAKEIETGKSFRASIELDNREEAEGFKAYLESFSTSGRYSYSLLEFDARHVEAFGNLPIS